MTRHDVESLVGRVLRTWQECRVAINPLDPRSVRRFQERFGVTLSADVAAFFCAHGGMPEGTSDRNLIRFWSLDEVVPVSTLMPERSGPDFEGYFLFADYSLWAHGYAVRISPSHGSDVVIVGGERPVVVASSLSEFLAKYLTDPRALF
jgi:hypothetical protein